MKKAGYILLLGGLLGAGLCFYALSGAALPFPDPTPELLARQEALIVRWTLAILFSLFVASIGVAVLFGAWRDARLARGGRGGR